MKRVVALQTGFYKGNRIRPGTVFDVPDEVTGKWFELYDGPEIKKPKPKKESGPQTFSEISRADHAANTAKTQ